MIDFLVSINIPNSGPFSWSKLCQIHSMAVLMTCSSCCIPSFQNVVASNRPFSDKWIQCSYLFSTFEQRRVVTVTATPITACMAWHNPDDLHLIVLASRFQRLSTASFMVEKIEGEQHSSIDVVWRKRVHETSRMFSDGYCWRTRAKTCKSSQLRRTINL